jgi:hypothetical protein
MKSWAIHAGRLSTLIFLVLGLSLLTTRGRVGGDELEVFKQVIKLLDSGDGVAVLLGRPDSGGLVFSHRLFWFIQQYLVVFVADLIVAVLGVESSVLLRGFAVAYSQTVVAWTCVVMTCLFLVNKMRLRLPLAVLVTTLIWFVGTGLYFLTGNFIENTMALLVIARLYVFYSGKDLSENKRKIAALLVIDLLLFAIKPYSLFFTTITLLLANGGLPARRRFLVLYWSSMLVLMALWLSATYLFLGNSWPYSSLAWTFYPGIIAERFFHALFSFSFGLIWCFPALFFAFTSHEGWRTIFVKVGALFVCLLFICLIPFWHGQVAGNRYLFPFLLFLVPEIARGFMEFTRRAKRSLLLVPFLFIVFLPSIDYRNTAISEYHDHWALKAASQTVDDADHPVKARLFKDDINLLYDRTFHPAVFAWQTVVAKLSGTVEYPPANSWSFYLQTRSVYPMTALSRVIYILEVRPEIGEDVYKILDRKGLSNLLLWQLLRALILATIIAAIFFCALFQVLRNQDGKDMRWC